MCIDDLFDKNVLVLVQRIQNTKRLIYPQSLYVYSQLYFHHNKTLQQSRLLHEFIFIHSSFLVKCSVIGSLFKSGLHLIRKVFR